MIRLCGHLLLDALVHRSGLIRTWLRLHPLQHRVFSIWRAVGLLCHDIEDSATVASQAMRCMAQRAMPGAAGVPKPE